MALRLGSGYIGSTEVQVSTANQEVVPPKEEGWTHGYNFYKFAFYNDQDCSVKINNKNTIFLRATQGFSMDQVDSPIFSFVIIEPNISYNFIGTY